VVIILRKLVFILSVFLIITLNFSTIPAVAETNKTFSEGIYTINDLNLLPNVPYKVQNVSGGKAFITILNGDLVLEQSIRFEANSLQFLLNPMQYDNKIVILGTGQLKFS